MLGNVNKIWHYPKLSAYDFGFLRTPGSGLGNLLLPVSRALIGQHNFGGSFIYPTMRQIKIGTFIRNEPDKRTYGNIMRPRALAEWKDWKHTFFSSAITEDIYDGSQKDGLVLYEGLHRFFHDLIDHHDLILSWLNKNVANTKTDCPSYDIAIHVRLGDFATTPTPNSTANVRLPIDWYLTAFEEAKSRLGMTSPKIMLFTDSNVQEVQKMLNIVNVIADPGQNALDAMINLSKAQLIITSRSTFSMWGAYLGHTPAIWDKGFDLEKYFPLRDGLDIQI